MARKYEYITKLYEQTSKDITQNFENWLGFLNSACKNYKLRFDEQILVYAQRPQAIAVLPIEKWNKNFGRWVNCGAKGIAVFERENQDSQRLTYYFDISDTHESKNSKEVPIWNMKDEYTDDVIRNLENTFGVTNKNISIVSAVNSAIENAVEDNIDDYLRDLLSVLDDSLLYGLDEIEVKSQFKTLVKNSVSYMIMSRLEIDTKMYFEQSDFENIINFNTQDTINPLGIATSDIAQMALTEISKTIMSLENKNRIIADKSQSGYTLDTTKYERGNGYESNNIQNGGRLQSTEPKTTTTAESGIRTIRTNEEELSIKSSESDILQLSDTGQIDRAFSTDTATGTSTRTNIDKTDVTAGEYNRGIESNGYDELGREDEQLEKSSAGDSQSTSDILIDENIVVPISISEQEKLISEQAEDKKSSAFSIPQEIIDDVLCSGSGFSEGKMRIYEQFEKSFSKKENVDFLKKEYGIGGNNHAGGHDGYNTWHDAKGISIAKGYEPNRPQVLLKWNEVEKRISDLIKLDRYLNQKEKESYPQWLEDMEIKRAELKEKLKNKEILSTPPSQNQEFNEENIIGKEIKIDDRLFVIESVGKVSEDVSMKDVTFQNSTGLPINRVEKLPYVIDLLKSQYITDEKQREENNYTYQYHLGDKVYLGSKEYEILSFDENRVMLYDYEMPLFNKEYSREEFDGKVRENPMNDHLKVTDLPAEEKDEINETQVINTTKSEQDTRLDTDYEDAFFIDRDSESVTWMYYNPDSVAGGQYVTNMLSFNEIKQAAQEKKSTDEFFDYLGSIARQELADVGTEWFADAQLKFKNAPDLTNCTPKTMKSLVSVADNEQRKLPEPIIPSWEQKKKTKVNHFDLYPNIPMSERNNFNLKDNPIEEVSKKERFKRNIEAIKVIKECEFENRFATADEQLILSKYVGFGGLSEAFDENNSAWADEFVELYSILSPEEYSSARESTLTAFYTPPKVIEAIYKVMGNMGFSEGNILEPSCGIGHFIGMLPKSMKNSKVYGVELDKLSADIARQLYQKNSIANQGFEETNLPDSFFDAVIGNVPFGDFKVYDKRYDKHKFLIHDFFFAKSLDKLRPGGVMALITSKGTMDKENSKVRKYIAQRADLLGAIRLPNNTFKGNAGTEVVSDILFLQKRDRLIDIEPDWVHLDTDENGIKMNSYFVKNPDMVLGQMEMVSGRFGMEATCKPYENANLSDLLNDAISNIHGEITQYQSQEDLDMQDNSIPADLSVRNFSYTVLDDKIYFRENSTMSPIEVSATAENRIKGMIAIRDSVRTLIELQTEDYPDEDIKAEQSKLNKLYDNFTKKYGLINNRANQTAFSNDSSYSLLSALEIINENGELVRKADMFFKRTIKPYILVTSVDTASEALAVSMGEKAKVDMEYMMELSGKSEEELFSDLKGVIFLNPLYEYGNSYEPKYLMADEYLSGNVREKLAFAKQSANIYPDDYKINVDALEKVQPKDLSASEISVRLGATWLPQDIVEQFMFELLETPRYAQWNIKVHFSPYTSEWNIEGKSYDRANLKAYTTYGTSRINAYKIIEETLNLKDVRIFDYVEDQDGKRKAVLNKKETAIAQAKQELIKQGFADWIWAEPNRREKLTKLYNEKFNSLRPREYDGSHITFSGMNPEIELREHQKNAVAHILYGGNTLLAHCVGAGKTFEMVAASQESKRLGLCNKSLFVVPNHLTEQWAAEYLQLYPAANILVATKKDFETKNRKKFCGRIATGDYDAVIIGHSQFEKIPMSIERQRIILEQQIEELTQGIAELKQNRGERFSIKQLEKSKRAIKLKLEKLNDQSRKDDVVTFEELGVDRLFVDESHYYKNLFLYTKMRNVGGIAQTEAQKSSDLFMKCRYLDEITGGRGVVFATGTPISNSMVELYTIQRYLQYSTLQKNNLQHFDAWASTFGETVTAVELTPEGTGYRAKTRFAKFYNLPELMAMFKEVADIKTSDMLNLPVPKANYHNIAVKPSDMQTKMVESLSERAEKVRNNMVDASVDNMLKITNDGRKLALDQRMLNDALPDFEGSKINACVDNVYRIWEENIESKATQLIFCDLSTPKNDGNFNVYDDIRDKLIQKGIPKEEIKFIHSADNDVKKKELFNKVRKGEVRVLLGSTQKMGAGTNVQDKLIALHDVDCPWRPSDLEQRSGRIVRQGNENKEVNIYRYVTEQTFDAYLYQLVEGKQKFASQIMTSKSPVRSAEDIDETALSYAEIKMLATGNPYIKEKMDLDIQVQKLRLLKSNFLTEKYALEDKVIKYFPQQIASLEERVQGLKKDVETIKNNPKSTDERFVGMTVLGVNYSEKADAGNAILQVCKSMTSPDPITLGEYRGFKTELLFDTFERCYVMKIKGETSKSLSLGDDVHGNITRIDNMLDRYDDFLKETQDNLENTKNQFKTAKKEIENPFVHEEELKSKTARLDELNILLNMDKKENEIVGGEPDENEITKTKKDKSYER